MKEAAISKISLFLIESRQMYRLGLYHSLAKQKDMEFWGEAESLEAALPMLDTLPPYSVVICGHFSPQDWKLVYQLKLRQPTTYLILLADVEEEELLFQALQTGAEAFLTRKTSGTLLADTIRQVFVELSPIADDIATHPDIAARLLWHFSEEVELSPGLKPLLAPATPKEIELLSVLAQGSHPKIEEKVLRESLDIIRHKLVANRRVQVTLSLLRTKKTPSPSVTSHGITPAMPPQEETGEIAPPWISTAL